MPGALKVVDFVGQESISQLFRFDLNLVSQDPQIDFAAVVNQPAFLTLRRGSMDATKIHGIVADFQQGGYTADWYYYRVTLVPRMWLLSLTYQSRIFQNINVQQIVEQVLGEYGFDFRFELSGDYPKREYCVQYRETDLNFICRLLEFEGIHFFFEYDEQKETLVMIDDISANPAIPGMNTIEYHQGAGFAGDTETIREFICREKVVTGKVILMDYNYREPATSLRVEKQLNNEMPGKYYEYGQHYFDVDNGNRLAQIRNEEIECTRRIMTGDGSCTAFRTGMKFALSHHYRLDLNDNYLLIQIMHSGSQGSGYGVPLKSGTEPTYRNDFTCITANIQYRPPRITPQPQIPGIMTAKVEASDANAEYAYIDEQGRYRVKMHFDLSEAGDGNASRPIRLAEPYSGPDYGIHFPNHANTEMVWACIDGNVDRPLGLSTVPNPMNQSPSIAENNFESVIRTAGQNELTFDDEIGQENIYLFGTKDWTIEITNDKTQTVGHDESLSVGNNRTKTVGNDQSESIGNNKTIDVGNDHTETIGANMTIDVSNNLDEHVGSDYSETVDNNMTLSVGKNKDVTIGDNLTEQVGKNVEIKIGKKTDIESGDDITVIGRKKAKVIIADELKIEVGGSSILMKSNGDIKISGNKIEIEGMQEVKTSAMTVKSEASMENTTRGTIVNVEASGVNTVKGSLVKINC